MREFMKPKNCFNLKLYKLQVMNKIKSLIHEIVENYRKLNFI